MSDLKVDTVTRDISVENGDLPMVMGIDAVQQALSQRLRSFTGDWFLDTSATVPYYESILKKNPDPQEVETIFQTVIAETPGVLEILSFELNIDTTTRRLSLSFEVRAFDGNIQFTNFQPGA